MSEQFTEEQIEKTMQDITRGLEISIVKLQDGLNNRIDGLTQKQLRRALKAIVNFPEPQVDLDALTQSERETIGELYTLHQSQVQLEIQVLGQLQKEQQEKEKNNG